MNQWKRTAIEILSRIEEPIDILRLRAKLRSGRFQPLVIQPYRGHGTHEVFYLKGRVLEGTGVTRSSSTDSTWQNIVNMYHRFTSHEMPGARVRAQVEERAWEAVTDREGYFSLRMRLPNIPDGSRIWNSVKLDLLEPRLPHHPPSHVIGHVLVPPPEAQFGIISDIDDTIVKTEATSTLRMLRIVLLTNAHTRVPFEGVAAFYRALRRGASGCDANPIFYVSSSPWNLYDLLIDFMNVHGIPYGPLFLRDFGFDAELISAEGHHSHKLEQIERLIEAYPQLRWILIGDSGQEDPEIYRQVVFDFPGHVKMIYIRDVTSQQRHDEVEQIAAEVRAQGVEMVLVKDTLEAAEHAAAHDFIQPGSVAKVQVKKAEDERAPTLLG